MSDEQTGVGIVGVIGLVILSLIGLVVLAGFSFMATWGGFVMDKASPQNIENQFREAYQKYESLEQLENNYYAKKSEVDSFQEIYGDPSTWEKDQRRTYSSMKSKVTSYKNQYARVAKDYNALMRDVFRGNIVGPPDLPKRVDTQITE